MEGRRLLGGLCGTFVGISCVTVSYVYIIESRELTAALSGMKRSPRHSTSLEVMVLLH